MKNICFLMGTTNGTGGIGRVVSILSDALYKQNKFNISIVGYSDNDEETLNCSYNYNSNINLLSLGQANRSMKDAILPATKKLRKLINKKDIDILICCGALYFPLGILSTKFSKTKVICWDHSNYHVNTDHSYAKLSRKIGAMFGDKVITLTKKDKKNYIKNEKIKNIDYIYNPLDPLLLNKQSEYNIESKKIISVGRLSYQKNFECLIEVANKIFSKHQDWEWHIYGDGDTKDLLREKISKYNLQDKVILKGRVNDLYDRYKDYSMLVMTSRYEGFPMTIIEGLAKKLPVISFDIDTGPDELIQDGTNGYLIEFENIDDMVNKIDKLIVDKELRKEMSNKSSIDIYRLEINNIVKKWTYVLESL